MPSFSVDDLTRVLESEPAAQSERLMSLLRSQGLELEAVRELAERLTELRERATRMQPPPTGEELALALLALVSLESNRREDAR